MAGSLEITAARIGGVSLRSSRSASARLDDDAPAIVHQQQATGDVVEPPLERKQQDGRSLGQRQSPRKSGANPLVVSALPASRLRQGRLRAPGLGSDAAEPDQGPLGRLLGAQIDLAVQRPEVVAARVEERLGHVPGARARWASAPRSGPCGPRDRRRFARTPRGRAPARGSKRAASQGSSGSWRTQRAASS